MIKKILEKNIENNKVLYILLTFSLIFGVCFGVFCINRLDDDKLNISKNYYSEYQENIIKFDNCSFLDVFFYSIKKEFGYVFIITVFAFIVFGEWLISIGILYKGFSIGYVISSILRIYGIKRGILFSIISLAFHNCIFIPCILFFSVYCINICKMIKNKNINFKIELIKILFVFLIILVIISCSRAIEIQISANFFKKMQKIL